ncbi:hypothetical protein [Flavisolibacter nicotianae]|uniref:hypothetical protein n=1 Tax=Flavisolibacter nicotianae TaxID=2364882 RepID=UPI000EAB7320|nr:hypothetical protein [Flavisolibacter nicotianae]
MVGWFVALKVMANLSAGNDTCHPPPYPASFNYHFSPVYFRLALLPLQKAGAKKRMPVLTCFEMGWLVSKRHLPVRVVII